MSIVLLAAVATLAGCPDRPVLIRLGGDPARGVLVNVTPGARPNDRPDPARPTVVFVHGSNPVPRLIHFTMAQRLAEALAHRPGPAFNVLGWDWNAATTDSRLSKVNHANAVRQGEALAAELQRLGLPASRVHLIGHSAGGMVAASAARVLAADQGWPVAQLTLLEPAACYHPVIVEQIGAGGSARLIENYWCSGPSGYGRVINHARVRNAQVHCPTSYLGVIDPLRSAHLFIVHWYIGTVADGSCPTGFGTSPLARE